MRVNVFGRLLSLFPWERENGFGHGADASREFKKGLVGKLNKIIERAF
jgi:hypothetical protein